MQRQTGAGIIWSEGTERMESELFRSELKTVEMLVATATHGSLAVIEYLVFVKTCI